MIPFSTASTGELVRASFKDATEAILSSSKGQKCFGWSFLSVSLRRAARRAKLGTNRLKTLQKPRNQLTSVYIAVCPSFATASEMCCAIHGDQAE